MHYWRARPGNAHDIATRGFDQGDPLSALAVITACQDDWTLAEASCALRPLWERRRARRIPGR